MSNVIMPIGLILGTILFGICRIADIKNKKSPRIPLDYEIDPSNPNKIICTRYVWDNLPKDFKERFLLVEFK